MKTDVSVFSYWARWSFRSLTTDLRYILKMFSDMDPEWELVRNECTCPVGVCQSSFILSHFLSLCFSWQHFCWYNLILIAGVNWCGWLNLWVIFMWRSCPDTGQELALLQDTLSHFCSMKFLNNSLRKVKIEYKRI